MLLISCNCQLLYRDYLFQDFLVLGLMLIILVIRFLGFLLILLNVLQQQELQNLFADCFQQTKMFKKDLGIR